MSNELMRYVQREAPVAKQDKEVAKQAKQAHDEVRLAAFKADGAMALAGHVMENVVSLDQHRRDLAGDDPVANQMLVQFEVEAIRKVQQIQRNLYNDWEM